MTTLEELHPLETGKTGIMHKLGTEGDVPIMWDRENDFEVEIARKAFDEARHNGFIVYRAEGTDGHRGEVVREFDPDAERLIMVAPHQGG